MKIILHACCGPCSTVPLRLFAGQGHELEIYYANSNIHPRSEYELRRDTIAAYAADRGIPFAEGEYEPDRWLEAIGEHRAYGIERCRRCYRMRLEETARHAAEVGADAIASSLTISPYQFTAAINEELVSAAEAAGVEAIESDFRDRYQDSVVYSREAGMYRQNFCGCMFSQVEAAEHRARARAERRLLRAKRRIARSARAALDNAGLVGDVHDDIWEEEC